MSIAWSQQNFLFYDIISPIVPLSYNNLIVNFGMNINNSQRIYLLKQFQQYFSLYFEQIKLFIPTHKMVQV